MHQRSWVAIGVVMLFALAAPTLAAPTGAVIRIEAGGKAISAVAVGDAVVGLGARSGDVVEIRRSQTRQEVRPTYGVLEGVPYVVIARKNVELDLMPAKLAAANPTGKVKADRVSSTEGSPATSHAELTVEGGSAVLTGGRNSDSGAVLFGRCGEILGLLSGGGQIVLADELAAILKTEGRSVIRARPCPPALEAAAAALSGGGVPNSDASAALKAERDDAVSQLNDLKKKAAKARTDADRAAIKTQLDRLAAKVTGLNAKIDDLDSKAVTTAIKSEEDRSALQFVIDQLKNRIVQIAVGAGAVILVAFGLALWWWTRTRKLKSALDSSRGADPWRDCVLDSASGPALKLPGQKLTNGGVVVGRSREEADVLLDSPDVSRRHARFEVTDDALYLTDLGSTNNTRVNDVVLAPHTARRLHEGDTVHIGGQSYHLRFLGSGQGS